MQAVRRWRRALHRAAGEGHAEAAEGLDHRGWEAGEGLPVHQLLPDDGVRERARLDLAPRGPPPGPAGRLQQVPRRVRDARDRRAVGERLHLRREVGCALQPLMKRVFGSFNQTTVYHARNLLEAAGIQVLVRNAALSSAMGELPPAECEAQLWVLDDADAARAEELLRPPASGPDW